MSKLARPGVKRFLFAAGASFALSLTLVGCGSEPMPEPAMELAPPEAGKGVQLKMVSTLSPGLEIERCMFVKAPPEGLNINHQEVRYTPGSHHVLLYATRYTTIPTVDRHGDTRDTSGVMDCPEGASADWDVSQVLGGAQSTHGGSLVSLPPGIAVKVPGNAIMLINTHYLNASPKELVADARINLYTIPDAEVQQEGGVLFFYNPAIRVPANGKASARMRCRVAKDITITNIQSHMHKRAVNYVADLLDTSKQKVETLYTNTSWDEVPVGEFDPGKKLATGSFLDYRCDYDNPESHTVVQGPSTKDEMCMLLGSYYPRHDETAFCADSTIVGTGTKSCGESMKCSQDALTRGNIEGFFGCLIDSCPAAADALNAAMRCSFSQGGEACKADCQDPSSPACGDCKTRVCKPAVDSCQMHTCG